MKKRVWALLLAIMMVVSVLPVSAFAKPGDNGGSRYITMTIDEQRNLRGYGSGADSVQWSTSNASVVTVDQTGKVKAVAAGTATVTQTVKWKYWSSWHWELRYYTETYAWYITVSAKTTVENKYQYPIVWNQMKSSGGAQQQQQLGESDGDYGKVTVKVTGQDTNVTVKSEQVSWSDATTSGFTITAAAGYKVTGVSLRCAHNYGDGC